MYSLENYCYSIEQHIPQEGWKQQQHDDRANLVWWFINEEILLTMRKSLEMEAKSYPQEEQHLSLLSLPFDFKIQCSKYHISSKEPNAVSNEVIIREGRENKHHPFFSVAKVEIIPTSSAFQVSMIDNILPFPPLAIYSSLWQPPKFIKKVCHLNWFESCYQLLQTNHDRACQLCHNHQFTEYNILFMCYHQNNSCSIFSETFMFSRLMNMWVMFDVLTGFSW